MLSFRIICIALCLLFSCVQVDFAPPTQCSDGIDNDQDELIDDEDFGCQNFEDDDESDDPPRCGNNVIDQVDEECDGDDLNGESCESLGLGEGTLLCSAKCVFGTADCTSLIQ